METTPYFPRISGKEYAGRIPEKPHPFRTPGSYSDLRGANGLSSALNLMPFDIIPEDPEDPSAESLLYKPHVRKSDKSDVDSEVVINMAPFSITADKWLVAKMVGPISTFLANPQITIEIKSPSWSGYPNAHTANTTEPYTWKESFVPLWRFVSEAEATPSMIVVAATGPTTFIYGQKLIGTAPQLVYTLAAIEAGEVNRLRTVPELI